MPGRNGGWREHPATRVVLVITVVLTGLALAVFLRPPPPPLTPPLTQPTTSTTVATTTSSTTTTIAPPATEPPPPPPPPPPTEARTEFDVIVVGDGLGGLAAAISSARQGASTLVLSPVGYLGGQAGAAGVSTMDEGGGRDVLRRMGLYGDLVDHLQFFVYGSRTMGGCYFSDDTVCPEPLVIDDFFRNRLGQAGVEIRPLVTVDDVLQEGLRVAGVIADGIQYRSRVLIDATEFSDLYPLIEGLDHAVGDPTGCMQDTTWVAIRNWYAGGAPSDLVPPQSAIDDLRAVYGVEVDGWLEKFRGLVTAGPGPAGPAAGGFPWSVETEARYRSLGDRRYAGIGGPGLPQVTRTGINLANDSPITPLAFSDPQVRHQELRRALHITYAFLWYLRWELGLTDWGVANDQGFEKGQRLFWDDLVPDQIERHLPPLPYLREGRRMQAVITLQPEDLADAVRGRHRFPDSVMLGGYFSDFHGCSGDGLVSSYGLFEVPIGVFIPQQVDGFLPGLVRAAGVSRVAAASLRTQPEEMWGGQVAGIIAGLAATSGVEPRQVPVADVHRLLSASQLIWFLP